MIQNNTNEKTTLGIKSFRIFFSYSTADKQTVGEIKKYLELLGFEVFLAHEDIEPGVEWQDEIIKNLRRSDIFIPLFTDSFVESKWTDQEIGIAIASEKFIIPLQMNVTPYGFIGKIQSLKIEDLTFKKIASEIVKTISTKSKFGEDIKIFLINSLALSWSFEQAEERTRQLDYFDTFSPEEVTV